MKRFKLFRSTSLLFMVLLTLALLPVNSFAEKPITLTFSTYLGANHIFVKGIVDWTKKIEAATNGRVKFKYFYGGTIVKGGHAWDELKKGTVDICDVPVSKRTAEFPLNELSQKIMYGIKDNETNYRIMGELERQIPEFADEWSGAKTLVARSVGDHNIQSIKPVRTLDDIKGMRLKLNGSWLRETFAELGASCTAVPSNETYTALSKGIINGNINNDEILVSFKTAEITKYTTVMGLYDGASTRWMMNLDKFKSLPADIQKIIDDSIPQLEQDYIALVNKANEDGIAYAKSIGEHEVIHLPQADLDKLYAMAEEEAIAAVKEADAKGLPGTKMFKMAREMISKQ